MNFTPQVYISPFTKLETALTDFDKGEKLHYYGEAVLNSIREEGLRYVTIEKQPRACSVNDNYAVAAFFTRENAAGLNDGGTGRAGTFLRTVDCVLAVNSKNIISEAQIASIINEIPELEYLNTDFNAESVSASFFGLEDQNFQTSFFTIRFRATEKMVCVPCEY